MSQFSFTNNVTGGNAQINQGQTVNATQTNNCGELSPSQIVEKVQQEFNELDSSALDKRKEVDPDETLPLFTPAQPAFQALADVASVPAPESTAVESAMTKFRQIVSERGPLIGNALCNGVVAGLKATAMTHPVVVAISSFLQTFSDDK